ncbi:TPA: hypothetical protein PZN16_002984 [Staphylococcus aureus]|nr:hypothetical protein [Staphylococcus aureus]
MAASASGTGPGAGGGRGGPGAFWHAGHASIHARARRSARPGWGVPRGVY